MPSKTMEDVFKLLTWERDGWPEAEGNDEEQEFSPPPSKS